MVRNHVVQLGGVEVRVRQTVLHARNGEPGGCMSMHDAMCVFHMLVNCAMNDETCGIDRVIRRTQDFTVQVDLDQVGSRDFVVSQSERVDQEVLVRTGHTQRNVIENQLGPAEHMKHAIRCGEIEPGLPFVRRTPGGCGQRVAFGSGHSVSPLTVMARAIKFRNCLFCALWTDRSAWVLSDRLVRSVEPMYILACGRSAASARLKGFWIGFISRWC